MTDLNITSESNANNNEKVQTVRIGLPIPKQTIPTISLEKSQLLSVSYFIRVQVFAQEGIYTTSEGIKSQFMMVDIPFIIGTLTTSSGTPISSPVSSSLSPISSPIISSPQSTLLRNSSNSGNSIKTSPLLSTAGSLLTSSFSTAVTPKPSTSTSTSASMSITPVASPELNKSTVSSIEPTKKSRIMSGMFRKTSSGSSHSANDEKKKKNVFSTLRLYGRNNKEVSPAVTMTQADREEAEVNKDQAIVETTNQDAGIFNIFGDDTSDCEQTVSVTPVVNEKVFKMFNDSDSEDDEEELVVEENKESANVFNMFPDSESDDDDTKIQVLGDHQSELMSSTETNMSASNLRLLSTHVFRMFDESDSDEEEEDQVNNLSISVQNNISCLDERVKPYQQNPIFKPNQII